MITLTLSTLTYVSARSEGESPANPFIWPIFFKIDTDTIRSVLCEMRSLHEPVPIEIEDLLGFLGYGVAAESALEAIGPLEGFCQPLDRVGRGLPRTSDWLASTDGSHGNIGRALAVTETAIIPTRVRATQLASIWPDLSGSETRVGIVVVVFEEDASPSDSEIRNQYLIFKGKVRERIMVQLKSAIRTQFSGIGSGSNGLVADDRGIIVFRDVDSHIQMQVPLIDSRVRIDLTTLGAAPLARSAPHAYRRHSDNSDHVVFCDRRGNIQDIWQTPGGRWRTRNLSSLARPPMGAMGEPCAWSDGVTEFVAFRVTSELHLLSTLGGDSWRFTNLTRDSRARQGPAADSLVRGWRIEGANPTVYSTERAHHVLYRDTEGRITQISMERGTSALSSEILPRPAVVVGDPFGLAIDSSQRVVFRGGDGSIHELQKSGTLPWRFEVLASGRVEPARPKNRNPMAYAISEILYAVVWRDIEGRIFHLLRSTKSTSGTGSITELTRLISAPRAAADPRGFFQRRGTDVQWITYKAVDGHIIILTLIDGRWEATDLTSLTGGVRRTSFDTAALESEITREIRSGLSALPIDPDDVIGTVIMQLMGPFPETVETGISMALPSRTASSREGTFRLEGHLTLVRDGEAVRLR